MREQWTHVRLLFTCRKKNIKIKKGRKRGREKTRYANGYTICPLCQTEVVTITHALRDCNMVRAIWHQLGICASNSTFFTQNLKDRPTTNGKWCRTIILLIYLGMWYFFLMSRGFGDNRTIMYLNTEVATRIWQKILLRKLWSSSCVLIKQGVSGVKESRKSGVRN